jgi:hypothetical protein
VPRKKKPKVPLPNHLRDIFAAFGKQGGKIGGKKRWENVSPEQRTAYAKRIASLRRKKKSS